MGDINIAIDGESAIHIHDQSIHEFLASSVASRDEVTAIIELVEIRGAIYSTKAGVSLVIELGEAEIILGRGFVGSEAIDSVTRISGDSVAEAGLETGEDGRTDTGNAGFARFIVV